MSLEQRVLVLAPTGKDAALTSSILRDAGVECMCCSTLDEVCQQLEVGAAAALLVEEAIASGRSDCLTAWLARQPAWSDLPLLVLARRGADSAAVARAMDQLGNVTVLERPTRVAALVSSIRTALRSRQRQYETREHLLQLHEQEQSQRQMAEALRDANQRKDEFFATLSHELRTPLGAILGWVQVVELKRYDPQVVKKGFDIISRNAKAQCDLIDDLLDMSRIISGKVRLELVDVDLSSVLRAALDSVQQSADAKHLRLEVSLDSTSQTMRGDFTRLQQVFWNLLNNAVKFTPENGRIEVTFREQDGWAVVSVRDSGRGIDPEFLPKVFDRFRQADPSASRAHGGLGLGLAIVKQLVELHGGTVRAESAGSGSGAVFTVELPFATRRDASSSRPPDIQRARRTSSAFPDLNGIRLLAVDDDKDTRAFLKQALEECHAEVLEADSVDEALLLLASAMPDMVISDIGMPQRDGYELLREMRARGNAIPAIALTAFAGSEDRSRALASGFQRHIGKPINLVELMAAISSLARTSR
jgi:signal transduction histidine kinase/CheY-like chemotaxis protein